MVLSARKDSFIFDTALFERSIDAARWEFKSGAMYRIGPGRRQVLKIDVEKYLGLHEEYLIATIDEEFQERSGRSASDRLVKYINRHELGCWDIDTRRAMSSSEDWFCDGVHRGTRTVTLRRYFVPEEPVVETEVPPVATLPQFEDQVG